MIEGMNEVERYLQRNTHPSGICPYSGKNYTLDKEISENGVRKGWCSYCGYPVKEFYRSKNFRGD